MSGEVQRRYWVFDCLARTILQCDKLRTLRAWLREDGVHLPPKRNAIVYVDDTFGRIVSRICYSRDGVGEAEELGRYGPEQGYLLEMGAVAVRFGWDCEPTIEVDIDDFDDAA